MSSKRLRKARYSIDRPAKVHDRTTAILPMDAHIVVDTVDDAYGIAEFATYDDERQELVSQGRPKVTVVRSIRSDPLAALKAQGAIDEVQFLAGQMWSWAHMRSEIGGVRAIDPTKERVDGGRIAEPLTDVVKRALDDLRRARLAGRHRAGGRCDRQGSHLGEGRRRAWIILKIRPRIPRPPVSGMSGSASGGIRLRDRGQKRRPARQSDRALITNRAASFPQHEIRESRALSDHKKRKSRASWERCFLSLGRRH
jgi:hypothetical protein